MDHDIVLIGTPAAGLPALASLLSALPAGFPLPVVVAAPGVEAPCAPLLGRCALPVHEIEDKEPVLPGHVYVCPPDYQVLFEDGRFALAVPEEPAGVAALFAAAEEAYPGRAVTLLLRGPAEAAR